MISDIHLLTQDLLTCCDDPKTGLPQEVFNLVSQLTPLVNVDLLIRDASDQTLLTWRNDEYYGPGWHIPGGIVRFKETFATRIAKVADSELGCTIEFDPRPLAVHELFRPQGDIRGHFISFLYNCRLTSEPAERLKFGGGASSKKHCGQWQWFRDCPELIAVHEKIYRSIIETPCPEASLPEHS
jgi:colanic acid biosynthesis protein WcaH